VVEEEPVEAEAEREVVEEAESLALANTNAGTAGRKVT
jgi:hypothetical protein